MVEPEQEEVLPNVRVCKEEEIEGKIEPERRALKSQRAGTSPEVPGQLCLSSKERQRTIVDGCSLADCSSDLGRAVYFQSVNQTYQLVSSRKIETE